MVNKIKRNCKICKKAFWVWPSTMKYSANMGRAIFCSARCFGNYNRLDKHPMWKERGISYRGIHRWMQTSYGKPRKCQNVFCKKKSNVFHWANISGEYKRDFTDWLRLCGICHKIYDWSKYKFKIKL